MLICAIEILNIINFTSREPQMCEYNVMQTNQNVRA